MVIVDAQSRIVVVNSQTVRLFGFVVRERTQLPWQGQPDPSIKFLQKPFPADALTRSVREVLDR
jgi:hypothetical protein